MTIKAFFIVTADNREHICRAGIMRAEVGDVVRIMEGGQSRDQQDKYHPMIRDIAKHCTFLGKKRNEETWKRLLIHAFVKDMRQQALAEGAADPFPGHDEILPSLDGADFIQVGEQSRRFSKPMASKFIESLYAYGEQYVDHDGQFSPVPWSESSKHVFLMEQAARRRPAK
jgi:hypothetical protein